MQNVFLSISIIIGLFTPVIGIYSIFKGNYKPQRITRIVLLVITTLFVLTLYVQGDTSGIFLAILQLASCFMIFVLSIKFGIGGRTKIDLIVLAMALCIIVIWQLTQDAELALYLAILADLVGFFPTIVKSYRMPYTESKIFYMNDTFAGFFNLLSVSTISFNTLAFPLYIFLVNLLCLCLIIIGRRKNKFNKIKSA